jgi:GNAT superfamily N-acetyltransferase
MIMNSNFIRKMELSELESFFKHIERDFPPGEYSPYDIVYRQLENENQEALVFSDGEHDLAYAVCAVNHDNNYVLISLFAVFEKYRTRGIGSAFILALKRKYEDMQGLIAEVERPELSNTHKAFDICTRRISFYERAGFYLIKGIDYSIWDVPMHLLALPLKADKETIDHEIGQIMHQIYLLLMGDRFINKMQFRTVLN